MNSSLWVQLAIGAVPLSVAVFSYIASTRANRTKVDAEAYDRARVMYEKILADMERRLENMGRQLDLVTDQLATERSTSAQLSTQVGALRAEVGEVQALRVLVARMRDQITTAGLPPPMFVVDDESGGAR